jgi:hypothetical protein
MVVSENALFDYIRDLEAHGINNATWELVTLYDDTVIASGTTGPDTDPNSVIDGMLAVAESVLKYPGPTKYRVTDPITGITREHTSKSIGQVGPIRLIDLPFMFAMMSDGVVGGFGGDFALTPSGTAPPALTAAPGAAFGHGMYYRCMQPQQVNPAVGGALARIDLIVVRYYLPGHEQEGRSELAILPGIPAATPVAPSPTQDATTTMIWEVPLGSQKMNAGQNIATALNFTDLRTYTFGPRLDSRYMRLDAPTGNTGGITVKALTTGLQGMLLLQGNDGTTRVFVEGVTPSLQLRNSTDFNIFKGNGTNLSFGIDGLSGHLRVADDKPVIHPGAALGPGGSATVEWGNDLMCEINLHAGSAPKVGDLCSLVFKRDRLGVKYGVWLQAQDQNAAETDSYISGRSVDGFHIYSRGPLKASSNHSFMVIMGGAQ